MFTVITRTSGRPRFFEQCRRSVLAQTMQPFHLVISDDLADTYATGDFVLHVQHQEGRGHNLYFNAARQHIPASHPWVIFLDDDDEFLRPNALERIAAAIFEETRMVLWQVRFTSYLIPGNEIGFHPKPGNISGIGFCYNSRFWVDWTPAAFGDFYVIDALYSVFHTAWIDEVLTGIQYVPGNGERKDLPDGIRISAP